MGEYVVILNHTGNYPEAVERVNTVPGLLAKADLVISVTPAGEGRVVKDQYGQVGQLATVIQTNREPASQRERYDSRDKLVSAALDVAGDQFTDTTHMHFDAQSELHDDRLLIAAREFVAAHEGVKAIPG